MEGIGELEEEELSFDSEEEAYEFKKCIEWDSEADYRLNVLKVLDNTPGVYDAKELYESVKVYDNKANKQEIEAIYNDEFERRFKEEDESGVLAKARNYILICNTQRKVIEKHLSEFKPICFAIGFDIEYLDIWRIDRMLVNYHQYEKKLSILNTCREMCISEGGKKYNVDCEDFEKLYDKLKEKIPYKISGKK